MQTATQLTPAGLDAYMDVIESVVEMAVARCDERELVRLEDRLAVLCGLLQAARPDAGYPRDYDPYREQRGRGVDGDKHARF